MSFPEKNMEKELRKLLSAEEAQSQFWKKRYDQAIEAQRIKERQWNEETQKLEAQIYNLKQQKSSSHHDVQEQCYCQQLVKALSEAEAKNDHQRLEHLRTLAKNLCEIENESGGPPKKKIARPKKKQSEKK